MHIKIIAAGMFALTGFYLCGEPEATLSNETAFSLTAWFDATKNIKFDDVSNDSVVTAPQLTELLQRYTNQQRFFLATMAWVDNHQLDGISTDNTLSEKLSHALSKAKVLQPFAQKLIIPVNSQVYFFGDLHGDIQALAHALMQLHDLGVIDNAGTIVEDHTHIIFLGDYVDRGKHGAEVIVTLLQLALANPRTVHLVRGNHEDLSLNKRYGFRDELRKKFDKKIADDIQQQIHQWYALLPVVLYLCMPSDTKTFCVQCCHGGIEIGYRPHKLWKQQPHVGQDCVGEKITELLQLTHFKQLVDLDARASNVDSAEITKMSVDPQQVFKEYHTPPRLIGFMWSDFTAHHDTNVTQLSKRGGGVLSFGKELTEKISSYYSNDDHALVAFIRGHQHHASMPGLIDERNKGVYCLSWEQPVFTTIATTQFNQRAGNPTICTFLRLQFLQDPSHWRLSCHSCDFSTHEWSQSAPTSLHNWHNAAY